MDDETDLGPARPSPGDEAVAAVLRAALDGRRPHPGLLGAVQRRAQRRHRRRVAGATAFSALAVAGVVALTPLGLPLGPQGVQDGGAPVASGPASSDPSEPPPSVLSEPSAIGTPEPAAPLTEASMLTLAQVGAALPGAEVVEAPYPLLDPATGAPPPVVGGFCVDRALDGVPAPSSAWAAMWADGPVPEVDAVNPGSVRQELLRWDSQADADAYLAAVAETVAACTDPASPPEGVGVYTLVEAPAELGGPAVVGVADLTPGQQRVRVVAASGTTALSLTAEVSSEDVPDVADLAVVALERAVQE